MIFKIFIADHTVYYSFAGEGLLKYFKNEMVSYEGNADRYIALPEMPMYPYSHMDKHDETYPAFMNALYLTSNYLLQYNICGFHAVALQIHGKGYLIAAASGVGKTTQLRNLLELYGQDVQIINGDKPFLKFTDDQIVIYPSPWRGKEDLGSQIVATLHGIVFLKQAKSNTISMVTPDKVAVRSIAQFIYYPESPEVIRKVCELDRCLLKKVPVWLFENTGDLNSSKLLYETVFSNGGSYE